MLVAPGKSYHFILRAFNSFFHSILVKQFAFSERISKPFSWVVQKQIAVFTVEITPLGLSSTRSNIPQIHISLVIPNETTFYQMAFALICRSFQSSFTRHLVLCLHHISISFNCIFLLSVRIVVWPYIVYCTPHIQRYEYQIIITIT